MYERILVPVDGSATGERGLQEAMRLAQELRASLVLLHVVDDAALLVAHAGDADLDAARLQWLARAGKLLEFGCRAAREAGIDAKPVVREVRATRVGDAINEEVRKRGCNLVVMGTHGSGAATEREALGSNADRVVRNAEVPVLLVRDPAR